MGAQRWCIAGSCLTHTSTLNVSIIHGMAFGVRVRLCVSLCVRLCATVPFCASHRHAGRNSS